MSIHLPDVVTVLRAYSNLNDAPKPHLRDGDIGRISSSIQRANDTYAGEELYPNMHFKIAVVIDSISRTHPLIDGNKRLAFLVMMMLYTGNGYRYVSSGSKADLFVWVADSKPPISEIAHSLSDLWAEA